MAINLNVLSVHTRSGTTWCRAVPFGAGSGVKEPLEVSADFSRPKPKSVFSRKTLMNLHTATAVGPAAIRPPGPMGNLVLCTVDMCVNSLYGCWFPAGCRKTRPLAAANQNVPVYIFAGNFAPVVECRPIFTIP